MCSFDGCLDWDDALQCVLHHASNTLLAAGAPAARHPSSSAEMGGRCPQCRGRLPICKRQLCMLGSCCRDIQPPLAAPRIFSGRLGLSAVSIGAFSASWSSSVLAYLILLPSCICSHFCVLAVETQTWQSHQTTMAVQGSVGFLTGSLLTQPLLIFAPSVLINEWFGMFAGYFLGSLCFLSGSYLTVAAPSATS